MLLMRSDINVFALFSMEYVKKGINKLYKLCCIYVLHSVPTYLESALYNVFTISYVF